MKKTLFSSASLALVLFAYLPLIAQADKITCSSQSYLWAAAGEAPGAMASLWSENAQDSDSYWRILKTSEKGTAIFSLSPATSDLPGARKFNFYFAHSNGTLVTTTSGFLLRGQNAEFMQNQDSAAGQESVTVVCKWLKN